MIATCTNVRVLPYICTKHKLEAMAGNRCSQLSLLLTALLFITTSVSVVSGQDPPSGERFICERELIQRLIAVFVLSLLLGVYLSLRGVTIPNDGYVLVSDIGFGDSRLLCNTDRSGCCRSSDGLAQGHWYLPDPPGDRVLIRGTRTTGNYFYRDRFTGQVRLNRVGSPSDRGRFRCEIPNTDGALVDLYVNIGE